MAESIKVLGFANLQRGFKQAGRDVRLGWRRDLRKVASPIQQDAQQLAAARITRIGAKWPRMRIGITGSAVYIAPREHGTHGRGRGSVRRQHADSVFAAKLMDRAMEPALEHNRAQAFQEMQKLVDTAAARFNGGH